MRSSDFIHRHRKPSHLRWQGLVLAVAAVTIVALTACGSDSSHHADGTGRVRSSATSSPSTEASAWTGPRIPDGEYRQLLTRKTLKKHGITQSPRELQWAPNGTLTDLLRINGNYWAQFENENGGAPSVGSSGGLSYDEQGRLVQTEDCCGESRYIWTLQGDNLTIQPDLAWMRQNHSRGEQHAYFNQIWTMMCCGTWTKIR
jgi:hypothetical protein